MKAVKRQLERRPDGWSARAALGKLLRYAGERRGLGELRAAGETWLAVSGGDRSLHTLMVALSLFRLAGEQDRTNELLRTLHSDLTEIARERGHAAIDTGALVEVCFLLGLDEEAVATNAALLESDRRGMGPRVRYPIVAELAAARAAGDPARCDPVVQWFDDAIRREREAPSGTGGINLHDWLEIALVVQSNLAGEPSPRLREI